MAFFDNDPTCDPCLSNQVVHPRPYTDTFTNKNYAFVLLDTSGGDTDSFRTLFFDFPLPQNASMGYLPLVPAGATITFHDSGNVQLALYNITLTQVHTGGSYNGIDKVQGSYTPSALAPIPQDTAYMRLNWTYTNAYGTNVVVRSRAFYFTPDTCLTAFVPDSTCYATNWIVYIGECGLDFCDAAAPITLRVNLNGGGFTTVGTFDSTKALVAPITLPTGQFSVTAWFDDETNKFYAVFAPGLSCDPGVDEVAIFVNGVETYDLVIASRVQLIV
jgi:hypothetical protein